MGLPRATYESILRDVDVPVCSCPNVALLAARYPGVKPDTICAIFAQENQHKVIKSHHVHKANMGSYCNRYLAGEALLELCALVDFPPCLMMRRMLELLLRLSKQRVSDVLKQPALLQTVDAAACLQAWHEQQSEVPTLQHQQHRHQDQQRQQQQLQACGNSNEDTSSSTSATSHPPSSSSSSQPGGSQGGCGGGRGACASDPALLLARLQADVARCVVADRAYSPYCDMAKSLAGLEHEALLCAHLDAAGIPHLSEAQLRLRGLFKTPDALLQVPVCMRGRDGCWHVVHWIDSKASFGDDRTHRQQLEGQYSTYVNRYGPGCVIYWFGFIADLAGQGDGGSNGGGGSGSSSDGGGGGNSGDIVSISDADVHVREDFPCASEIRQLPQLGGNDTAA